MRKTYHKDDDKQEVHEVQDALELYAREGARLMLSAALEEEVSAFWAVVVTNGRRRSRGIETATMGRVS